MNKKFGLGGRFHKAPEAREEEEAGAEATRERLTREAATAAAESAAAELDARFREALADGEITGDIVAVDERGREVKSRKRSNIFDP